MGQTRQYVGTVGFGEEGQHRLRHGTRVQRDPATENGRKANALRAVTTIHAHGMVTLTYEQMNRLSRSSCDVVEMRTGDLNERSAVPARGSGPEDGDRSAQLVAGVFTSLLKKPRGLERLEGTVELIPLDPHSLDEFGQPEAVRGTSKRLEHVQRAQGRPN